MINILARHVKIPKKCLTTQIIKSQRNFLFGPLYGATTLSIMAFNGYAKYFYAECHNKVHLAECHGALQIASRGKIRLNSNWWCFYILQNDHLFVKCSIDLSKLDFFPNGYWLLNDFQNRFLSQLKLNWRILILLPVEISSIFFCLQNVLAQRHIIHILPLKFP